MTKSNPQSVIASYQKRRRLMPFLVAGLAILLAVVGLIILIVALSGPGGPLNSMFASATPTVTLTPTSTVTRTPTATNTSTPTPTVTETPTVTLTPTPLGPIQHTVKENETCWGIAQQYQVPMDVMLAINPGVNCATIKAGDVLFIPLPGQTLPTETPISLTGIPAGTYINHTVRTGQSLATIAAMYNSTVDQIKRDNNITDINRIEAGQVLRVKVNIVTPTFTPTITSTRIMPSITLIQVTLTSTRQP